MEKLVLSRENSVLTEERGRIPRVSFLTEVLIRRPELSKEEAIKLADELFVSITGGKSNPKETAFFYTYVKEILFVVKKVASLPVKK